MDRPDAIAADDRPTLLLSANAGWNIAHFRGGLVRRLAADGWRLVVAVPASGADALAGLPVETVPIELDRSGVNPLAERRVLAAYRALLEAIRPAACLSWTIKPNIYGTIAARRAGVPALANVSGLGTTFLRGGLAAWLVGRLYLHAFKDAVVFFQNRDDRDLFVTRRLVRSAQALLLPGSGIDLDRFAPAPLPDGPPIFLLIARLLVDKGVRDYIAAAERLRAAGVEARIRLVGPLDPGNRSAIGGDELQRWIDQGLVDYRGEVSDVRSEIAAAHVVVLPSYREGLPRALLEGAAMARPLLATDVPGCRDLVEDGVNGLLCRVRDPASLAAAMSRLARLDRPALQAMGERSRRLAEDRFGEQQVIEAYRAALGVVTGRAA